MRLQIYKTVLIVSGVFLALVGASELEQAISNQNIFSIVVAVLFIVIGLIMIYMSIMKKKLKEEEQILFMIYESHLNFVLKKIGGKIRKSDLYTDLINRLDRIEEKEDRIIKTLGFKD